MHTGRQLLKPLVRGSSSSSGIAFQGRVCNMQDRRPASARQEGACHPGPLARALSAQHSATIVNYGGIGALPLYKAYSQSVESSLDNSPTKVFLLDSVS